MKTTNKVLSLVLALAMLLTVATFPAAAEGPAFTLVTAGTAPASGNQTIALEASENMGTAYHSSVYKKSAGPYFFARPLNHDITAGDILAVSNVNNVIPADALNSTVMTGFVLQFGRTRNEVNANKVYVKLDTDGRTILSMHASETDMINGQNPVSIKLDATGKWMFASRTYYDASNTAQQATSASVNDMTSSYNPYLWAIDVVETKSTATLPTAEPDVTAQSAALTLGEGYEVYMPVPTPDGLAYNTNITSDYYDSAYVNGKGDPTAKKIMAFSDGLRVDFDTISYVESVEIDVTWYTFHVKYSVLGSIDGENWVHIADGDSGAATGGVLFTVPVNSVVKYLRIDFNDFLDKDLKYAGGAYSLTNSQCKITEIKGVLNVQEGGSSSSEATSSAATSSAPAEAPKNVTLVLNATGDKFKVPDGVTVNVGDTVTVPVDTAVTFVCDGGTCAGASVAHTLKTWGNWYVRADIDGTVNNKYYSTKSSDATYVDGMQKSGTFSITEVGTFWIAPQYWGSPSHTGSGEICERFTVTGYAATTSSETTSSDITSSDAASSDVTSSDVTSSEVTSSETTSSEVTSSEPVTAENGYAYKEIWLEYNPETNRYEIPEGLVPRVGDTLRFDKTSLIKTTLMNGSTPTETTRMEPLFNSTTLTISKDLNKNGSISSSNVTAGKGELTYYATWPRTSSPSDSVEIYKDPAYLAKNEDLFNGKFVIEDLGIHQGWRQSKDGYRANPTGQWAVSYWLGDFTVTETAFDPALVAPTSNEIVSKPRLETRIGVDAEDFNLTFRVKMVENEKPNFVFSDGTVPTVTADGQDANGYYFIVKAQVPVTDDVTTVNVNYGENFRIEDDDNDTFTRTKSAQVFNVDIPLEGDNLVELSSTTMTYDTTTLYVGVEVFLQKLEEGVETVVIDGVEYDDVQAEFISIEALGGRLAPMDVANFKYNEKTNSYTYIASVLKTGVDRLKARVELLARNTETGEYVTLDECDVFSKDITVNKKVTTLTESHIIGGSNPEKLVADLIEKYGDESYVVVDCTEILGQELMWKDDAKTIPDLDKNGEQKVKYTKGLAYKDPASSDIFLVEAALWNALIDMNKDYIEFKLHARTNGTTYGKNNRIYVDWKNEFINTIEYSIRIYKEDHSMMQLEKGEHFRIGLLYDYTGKDKVTGKREDIVNAIKTEMGKGYQPLPFSISWWVKSVPFTQATLTLELDEEWTKRNGYEDLRLFKYSSSSSGGISSPTLVADGLKVNNRFDNDVEIVLPSASFYSTYFLVGEDGSVERPSTNNKYNVNTGAADLACTFATFAAVGLLALALKKRED